MIPRTFRFDKYRFNPAKALEDVPLVEALRPVEGGGHAELKVPARNYDARARSDSGDAYADSQSLPEENKPHFGKIRSLWNPAEEPSLVIHPLKILIGVDDSQAAWKLLQAASKLVQLFHCQMILTQVVTSEPEPGSQKPGDSLQALVEKIKALLPEAYLKAHAPKSLIIRERDPASGLLSAALQESASLIMVGSLPKSQTEIVREGSILNPLLSLAPCPVLVWREFRREGTLGRILVPVDGTPFSYLAIQQAIQICQEFGGSIEVLHVSGSVGSMASEQQELNRLLSKMAWHGVSHTLRSREGDIVREIVLECGEAGVDLIVMGTHGGQTGNTGTVAGKTQEVARQVPCSVLVVHPHA